MEAKGRPKQSGSRVDRREPRAGGYLISSDDGRYLQEFEPANPSALTRKPSRCSCSFVGSGWENERSWVARVYIKPAELILSFELRELWLSLSRSLSLRLSLTPSLNLSLGLSFNLRSGLSPRLALSLIMIMKETERAKEKKEKQKKKKQKNIITRRNERKNIELDSPKVASEMPWRCFLLYFLGGCCSQIVRYRKASVPK